jgi:Xaa-Pro aminopeptidase
MSRHAELAEIDLPDFGVPVQEPLIPAETYRRRLDLLRVRAKEYGFDYFIVYGDREHFANTAYLTGFDPRFEESLLVLDISGREDPAILVGNEGWGYLEISPIRDGLRCILFQRFSLMGQERREPHSIEEILREEGLTDGVRTGVAGWKYFTPQEDTKYKTVLEIPSYIADALRTLCGFNNVRNGGSILMDSSRGLRTVSDVDQLARFEYAASHTSQAVRDVIFGLRPGMTEFDVVRLMRLNALPLSAHLMLSSGPRAFIGLPSPSSRRIERGDPFTTAYGVWGALNCRAGFVVEDATELPMKIRDYVEKLVAPYYEAIAGWYERVGIGVSGGELY